MRIRNADDVIVDHRAMAQLTLHISPFHYKPGIQTVERVGNVRIRNLSVQLFLEQNSLRCYVVLRKLRCDILYVLFHAAYVMSTIPAPDQVSQCIF